MSSVEMAKMPIEENQGVSIPHSIPVVAPVVEKSIFSKYISHFKSEMKELMEGPDEVTAIRNRLKLSEKYNKHAISFFCAAIIIIASSIIFKGCEFPKLETYMSVGMLGAAILCKIASMAIKPSLKDRKKLPLLREDLYVQYKNFSGEQVRNYKKITWDELSARLDATERYDTLSPESIKILRKNCREYQKIGKYIQSDGYVPSSLLYDVWFQERRVDANIAYAAAVRIAVFIPNSSGTNCATAM